MTVTTPASRTPHARAQQALELMRLRKLLPASITAAGFGSLDEVIDAVAQQFRLPRVELDSIDLPLSLAGLIAKNLVEKHRIVPVFASPQEVSIATCDPTQIELFDWLGRELKRAVTVVMASPFEIDRAILRIYEAKARPASLETPDNLTQEALLEATQAVNTIIAGALDQHASDIHIEATERQTMIRYRVDGVLRVVDARPISLHPALISRIKVLAQLDISIHHVPQDGRVKIKGASSDIDLRVSVLPTYWGEKVVCRVLDNAKALLPLDGLGFEAVQRSVFERMIRAPYGLILVTGPTGSGKSTTLYSALNTVRSPELNIVTVEDPIEYQLPGINQVQVAPKRGLTFANSLRSILRQDPDVILVGEIRDHETGVLAAEAALTGHLVMSSLHTNDAIGSITRLTEMGVEPYLVAPSLVGVVAQRLMRRVCSACVERYEPDADELAGLGLPALPPGTSLARGRGCEQCHRTGHRGRIAVRELLEIDDGMRGLIASGAEAEDLHARAARKGFRPMRYWALRLLLAGTTTTTEVMRVTRS